MRANVLLLGSQTPTLLFEPRAASDWSLGDLAVEWAEQVAGYDLYPWQKFCVRSILARRGDGLWAARDAVLEVTRQQGKNVVLEVVELFLVFCVGARLIVHSAHRADTSAEHFIRLRATIRANDDLMAQMAVSKSNDGFTTANGKEAIELGNGARILFKARQSNSGRGPSPQVIVIDEAFDCPPSAIGSLAPSLTAQRNPLLIFASSAPKASSLLLHDLQGRALEANPEDRLLYIGWRSTADDEQDSDDAIARVSPSLGLGRVTLESIRANQQLLRRFPGEFEREHLGIAEEPLDEFEGVVPEQVWVGLVDPHSQIVSAPKIALDVSPDRKWAAFGAAGRRKDARFHVEIVDRRPGTSWVLDRAADLEAKYGAIIVQSGSPAHALVSPLREAGRRVDEVSKSQHAQALGQFLDAANAGGLRHRGQSNLDSALRSAQLQVSGDVEVWGRRSSKTDICGLVAVTLALGAVPNIDPSKKPGRAYSW